MNDGDTEVESIVDAMAQILGFVLTADSLKTVIEHLGIAFRLAPSFMDFHLPDDAEPAEVFTA